MRARESEKGFMAVVVKYARLRGWLVYHTHDARRSVPGFPDLVLVRAGHVIFAELKTATGKTTAAQDAWLSALRATGNEVHLWRPSDWPMVEAALH